MSEVLTLYAIGITQQFMKSLVWIRFVKDTVGNETAGSTESDGFGWRESVVVCVDYIQSTQFQRAKDNHF